MMKSFSQSDKYPLPRFGKTSASPKSDAGFQIWNREKLPLRPGVGTIRIRKPAIRRKYEQGFLEPVEHVDFVGDESHSSQEQPTLARESLPAKPGVPFLSLLDLASLNH